MRAFGYQRGDELSAEPTELREVSLVCTVDELRRLQGFLAQILAERSAQDAPGRHDHLRDRDPRWRQDDVDVILVAG